MVPLSMTLSDLWPGFQGHDIFLKLLFGDRKGIRPQKLLQFLFFHGYLWLSTKMGRVQPIVPRGQPHLPTRNRTMRNLAKLQDGVPVIMKVIDLMPCREAGGRWKNTSNVPVCVRFSTWNIWTMTGKSVEVVFLLWKIGWKRKVSAPVVYVRREMAII